MDKLLLFGLTLHELQDLTATLGAPRYTAQQIAQWLYAKRVDAIDGMTNISKALREKLNMQYTVGRRPFESVRRSTDGTRKYLFRTGQGAVETAYIPDADRRTLCVSSQVGCRMGCRFCMTGRMGYGGSLTAGEILNQLVSIEQPDTVTNIVFMGMGEPMDNLDAVLKAVDILTAGWGFALSPRRITVSTIGIPAAVEKFLDQCQAHLAVSLHSPFNTQRAELMPIEKAHPIEQTIALLRRYNWTGQRRLTFEYTLFDHLNDTPRHADQLRFLLRGLPCRVNIIAYNTIPDAPYAGASPSRIEHFAQMLNERGLTTTVRHSKGADIDAACGLLSTRQHAS